MGRHGAHGCAEQLTGMVGPDGVLPRWNEWFPPDALAELVPDERARAEFCAEVPRVPLRYLEEVAGLERMAGRAVRIRAALGGVRGRCGECSPGRLTGGPGGRAPPQRCHGARGRRGRGAPGSRKRCSGSPFRVPIAVTATMETPEPAQPRVYRFPMVVVTAVDTRYCGSPVHGASARSRPRCHVCTSSRAPTGRRRRTGRPR